MRLFIEILIVLLVTIVLPVYVAHLKERKEEKEYRKKEEKKKRKIEKREEFEKRVLNGELSLYGDFESIPKGMYVTRTDLYINEEEAATLEVYCHRDQMWKNASLRNKFIPLLKVEQRPLGVLIRLNPINRRIRIRYSRYDNIYKVYCLTKKY